LNHRNVLFVGLAAVATVLTGCAAQYRNPGSCVAEMRSRLDETAQQQLKITNRAVSYRGQRVVVEGHFEHGRGPVGAAAGSVGAGGSVSLAGTAGSSGTTASSDMSAAGGSAQSTVRHAVPDGTTSTANAPVSASAPASVATQADAATDAVAEPRPTTPVGALVAHFARPRKTTPVAAECTFDESGLTSFRWLAPADLAKTTPAPARSE
jgi:hypothetical protein